MPFLPPVLDFQLKILLSCFFLCSIIPTERGQVTLYTQTRGSYPNRGFYLGQNGTIKIMGNVSLTCQDKNRVCSEFRRFENFLVGGNPFKAQKLVEVGLRDEEGDDSKFPALTCTNDITTWKDSKFR